MIIEPGAIATQFGNVVDGPLMKYSGKGAYSEMAKSVGKGIANTYSNPNSISSPTVVAKAVSRAVNSKRPKTRYAIGKFAKPLIFARKFLGDRIFDRIALLQVR